MNRTLLSAALAICVISGAWGQSILRDTRSELSAAPGVEFSSSKTTVYTGPTTDDSLTQEQLKELSNDSAGSAYDSLDGENSRLNRVKTKIINAQAVPEPGTMIALGAGAAIFFARKRRKAN